MKTTSEQLTPHIAAMHEQIQQVLQNAGINDLRVQEIHFMDSGASGCPPGTHAAQVCHTKPDGSTVCDTVCQPD